MERFIYVIRDGNFWRYWIHLPAPRSYGCCCICGDKMDIGTAHYMVIQERRVLDDDLKEKFGGEYCWHDFEPHQSWFGHKQCLEPYMIGEEVPYDRRFDLRDNQG